MSISWQHTVNSRTSNQGQYMGSKSYTCGYCGEPVASDTGYYAHEYDLVGNLTGQNPVIYLCHQCNGPTYFSMDGKQTPGSAFGGTVEGIPSEDVEALYEEARNCMKVGAHTAAILCCRKLLMNIAVAKGAETNKPFAYYVDYLANQGYLPPDGKEWVDLIRKKGNEATHEIAIMEQEDAEELITFSEMLLRFIYEYPARIRARAQAAGQQTGPKNIGTGSNPPT